eukprot:scaffold1407_cov120-Isochrysis_galbana.AAC.1
MFRLAGAQVATCDLLPSEIDYVPHFQGDCKHIQDQGWDLVIGHPPLRIFPPSARVGSSRSPKESRRCAPRLSYLSRYVNLRPTSPRNLLRPTWEVGRRSTYYPPKP